MWNRLNNKSRLSRGVTLTEVLISIGLLAVGLLGVAAVFPVGSYNVNRGEVANRGAAIAKAAFADLVASDKLNPNNWWVWNSGSMVPLGSASRNWTLGAIQSGQSQVQLAQDYNAQFGSGYIIDPIAMSQGTVGAQASTTFNPGGAWDAGLATAPYAQDASWWPIRRLCVSSVMANNANGQLRPDPSACMQQFSSSDDLAVTELDADAPARLQFSGADASGDGVVDVPLRRLDQGDFSWFVSIAPTTPEALTALGTDPSAHYYDVSVVVFYKRVYTGVDTEERRITGTVVATGTGGGEILLDAMLDPPDPLFAQYTSDPQKYWNVLRNDTWVQVTARHPNSTADSPRWFSQWYRVVAVDEDRLATNGSQRLVGLRGPDWPWDAPTTVSVAVYPGAVAVHTKTMRLDDRGVWKY